MARCPSHEHLIGLRADRLSEPERADIVLHIEGCHVCRDALTRLAPGPLSPELELGSRASDPHGRGIELIAEHAFDAFETLPGRDPVTISHEDALHRTSIDTIADPRFTRLDHSPELLPATVNGLGDPERPTFAVREDPHPTVAGVLDDPGRTVPSPGPTMAAPAQTIAAPAQTIAAPTPTDPAQTVADPAQTVADPAQTVADPGNAPPPTVADTGNDPYRTTVQGDADPYQTAAVPLERTFGRSRERAGSAGKGFGVHVPDFEILAELGRGGMGVVYKARHLRLNRLVALKMIRGGGNALPEQLDRFQIEAEAVARLRHPHIVQIYDIGECDGLPFVSLELLEGGSLADRLKGTPQTGRQAAELMVKLAQAMEAAHRAGIVHRDLKPSNVLFTQEGEPRIADFGLAKRLEEEDSQTQTGQVMGTPSYMAPEQALGQTRDIGPAADVYALGAILYEMLTGRPPFKGPSPMETVRQVIDGEAVPPSRLQPKVPRDLETICMKCLEKEPSRRFASAQALADDLGRYLAGQPIRARRTPLWERGVKWARRHPTTATLMALGLATTIGLLAAGLKYHDDRLKIQQRQEQDLANLRVATANDLVLAREALSKKAWADGTSVLRARLVTIEEQPRLADLRTRAEALLEELNRGLRAEQAQRKAEVARALAQERYREFHRHRNEALFHDSRFTGLPLAVSLERTRRSAEAALKVFAPRGQDADWGLEPLPPSLSLEQQEEIWDGFYEMLLVLAEALTFQDKVPVDRALRVLEQADKVRPKHTSAYYLRLADCLAKKKDREGERSARARAEQTPPVTAFDHFLSGQRCYKRNDWAAAIRHFETALTQESSNPFWTQCLLAICFSQTPRVAEARSYFSACIKAEPDLVWLYLLRGFASSKVAASDLKQAEAFAARGEVRRAAALHEEAEFHFGEAEEDFRTADERLARAPDRDLSYALFSNRGLMRYQQGRLSQAAADFEHAITLAPDRFQAYAELAHVNQRQGRIKEAIEQFDRAIDLRPDEPALYRGRAEVYLGLTDPDSAQSAAALADLEEAIWHEREGNPVLALDYTNQARMLRRLKRLDDALAASQAALALVPGFAEAHRVRLGLLLEQGRFDDVLRLCDGRLMAANPSAELYYLRGLAKAGRDDLHGAIDDYTLALERDPGESRYLVRRGWSYLITGSATLALDDFNRALEHDPSDGEALCGRAGARVALRRVAEGVQDVKEALRRTDSQSPSRPRVVYNAARIYAQAAEVTADEVGQKGRLASRLVEYYQDRALGLVREAVLGQPPKDRMKFLREKVLADPVFRMLRRRLNAITLNPTPAGAPE